MEPEVPPMDSWDRDVLGDDDEGQDQPTQETTRNYHAKILAFDPATNNGHYSPEQLDHIAREKRRITTMRTDHAQIRAQWADPSLRGVFDINAKFYTGAPRRDNPGAYKPDVCANPHLEQMRRGMRLRIENK